MKGAMILAFFTCNDDIFLKNVFATPKDMNIQKK